MHFTMQKGGGVVAHTPVKKITHVTPAYRNFCRSHSVEEKKRERERRESSPGIETCVLAYISACIATCNVPCISASGALSAVRDPAFLVGSIRFSMHFSS